MRDNARDEYRRARGLDWHSTIDIANTQPLLHALARLVVEGTPGAGSYLIVDLDDVFVQVAGSHGDTELWIEAVSNQYLPESRRLAQPQIDRLLALGFAPPTRTADEPSARGTSPNFGRHLDIGSETRLHDTAQLIAEVLYGVYGCAPGHEIRLSLHIDVWPATDPGEDETA